VRGAIHLREIVESPRDGVACGDRISDQRGGSDGYGICGQVSLKRILVIQMWGRMYIKKE